MREGNGEEWGRGRGCEEVLMERILLKWWTVIPVIQKHSIVCYVPLSVTCLCLLRAYVSYVPLSVTFLCLLRASVCYVPLSVTCLCLLRASVCSVPLYICKRDSGQHKTRTHGTPEQNCRTTNKRTKFVTFKRTY